MLGNGVNDLDGSGGEFELTMMFGTHTVQPDPQLITFNTVTTACVFTEQFPLAVGETVTFLIRSPNPADVAVYLRTCVYEVAVESIRDELADLKVKINAVLTYAQSVLNVYNDTAAPRTGVYVQATATGSGVYP